MGCACWHRVRVAWMNPRGWRPPYRKPPQPRGTKAMDRLPRLIVAFYLPALAVGIATAWFGDQAEDDGAGPRPGAVGQVGENSRDAPPSRGSPGDTGNDEPLPAHLLSDLSVPSMCDGLSPTADSGMASLLRARGLADQLPADVAAEVGPIRGFYCSTDVLADKVAIIFIGQDGSGFALSNDPEFLDSTIASHREWADIPSDGRLTSVIGRVNDHESHTSDNVNIESLLDGADK